MGFVASNFLMIYDKNNMSHTIGWVELMKKLAPDFEWWISTIHIYPTKRLRLLKTLVKSNKIIHKFPNFYSAPNYSSSRL